MTSCWQCKQVVLKYSKAKLIKTAFDWAWQSTYYFVPAGALNVPVGEIVEENKNAVLHSSTSHFGHFLTVTLWFIFSGRCRISHLALLALWLFSVCSLHLWLPVDVWVSEIVQDLGSQCSYYYSLSRISTQAPTGSPWHPPCPTSSGAQAVPSNSSPFTPITYSFHRYTTSSLFTHFRFFSNFAVLLPALICSSSNFRSMELHPSRLLPFTPFYYCHNVCPSRPSFYLFSSFLAFLGCTSFGSSPISIWFISDYSLDLLPSILLVLVGVI